MKLKSISAVAAMTAMAMLRIGPGIALADPMLCSGDFNKACIADCAKIANRAAIPSCLTNCRILLMRCTQTGCWDGPKTRYCNLLRK